MTKRLLKKNLEKNKTIRQAIKTPGTVDFSIIDKTWVKRVYLDRNRFIKKSDATKDKEILKAATLVFQEAQKKSKFWNLKD